MSPTCSSKLSVPIIYSKTLMDFSQSGLGLGWAPETKMGRKKAHRTIITSQHQSDFL